MLIATDSFKKLKQFTANAFQQYIMRLINFTKNEKISTKHWTPRLVNYI